MTSKKAGAAAAPESSTMDPVVELLESADARADVFQVSEYNASTGRYDYLEQLEIEPVKALGIEEFSVQRYGGGKYNWRQRRRNGKYGKSAIVSIAGDPKARDFLKAKADAVTAAAAASGNATNDLVNKVVLLFAGALAPVLVKKLLEGPPPAPDRVDELLKLAAVLKTGNGDGNATSQATAMLGLMRELTEFQEQLTPKGGRGDRGGAIERVVDRLGAPVIDLLERKLELEEKAAERAERRRLRGAADPGGPAAGSGPAPVSGTMNHASDAGAEDPAALPLEQLLLRIPREARKFLLECARADKSPELYAELMLDRLDEKTYAALSVEIQRDDALEVMLATVPAYAEHREWFSRFVDAVRASLSEGTSETEGAGGAATQDGNGSHAGAPAA